jgi:hypothetical protein
MSKAMRYVSPGPTGLKPTLRQMMIVILWVALLLALMQAMQGWGLFGDKPELICMNVGVFIGTWPMPLLGVLLLGLDRPGPVRGWYFTCCNVGWAVLAGASFPLMDAVCLALCGRPTLLFPLYPFIAVVMFWGGTMQLRVAWPKRCPCCGRQAVIATWETASRAPPRWRKMAQGWCANCGAACEREGLTAWLPKADGGDGLRSTKAR